MIEFCFLLKVVGWSIEPWNKECTCTEVELCFVTFSGILKYYLGFIEFVILQSMVGIFAVSFRIWVARSAVLYAWVCLGSIFSTISFNFFFKPVFFTFFDMHTTHPSSVLNPFLPPSVSNPTLPPPGSHINPATFIILLPDSPFP